MFVVDLACALRVFLGAGRCAQCRCFYVDEVTFKTYILHNEKHRTYGCFV